MNHLLAFAACVAGFAALAGAMSRHQRDLLGRDLTPAQVLGLRVLGGGLLALAIWPCAAALGSAQGLVAWTGHLSAAAGLVFLALFWRSLGSKR